MRLPTLLPKELKYTEAAENDNQLFEMLVKNPREFVTFFEAAVEDETWSSAHTEFLRMMLNWITEKFYQDKVDTEFGTRLLAAVHAHVSLLEELIPKNITLRIGGGQEIPISGFLWGASSDKLRNLIRRECRDKDTTILALSEIPSELFDPLNEFIYTGLVYTLATRSQNQITELLQQALMWDLVALIKQCELALKKYISNENVYDLLIMAHKKRLPILRQACFEFIQDLDSGVFFKTSDMDSLILGFTNMNDKGLAIFEKLQQYITHLAFPGVFDESLLKKTPNLRGIDLTLSLNWSDNLLTIPVDIKELNLSQCAWLTSERLHALFLRCPLIERLSLANNPHLHYSAWSQLQSLKDLEVLDLAQCDRIEDEEFKLIVHACKRIRALNLESCSKIDEGGFIEMSLHLNELSELNLTNTNVTDTAVAAIIQNCPNLVYLNLTRCRQISPLILAQIKKSKPTMTVKQ